MDNILFHDCRQAFNYFFKCKEKNTKFQKISKTDWFVFFLASAKGPSALKILKSTKEFSNCTKLPFGNNNPCWVITCDISWIVLEKSLAVVEKKHSEFFVSLGAKVLYTLYFRYIRFLKENPKNRLQGVVLLLQCSQASSSHVAVFASQ